MGGTLLEKLEERLPEEVKETEFSLDQSETELDLETGKASSWLLGQDLLQTIGYSVGLFLFLIVCAGIVYLECRSKETRAVFLPIFDSYRQSVERVPRGGQIWAI